MKERWWIHGQLLEAVHRLAKAFILSGGVGIGGVLEPLQASPVIVEDGCFIGKPLYRSEGVIVEKEAVTGCKCCFNPINKNYRCKRQ
jgi:2,3,4,5-tetrahydropyridine-2,6-dicarboxylate N-succinyltransferase